MRSPPKRCARWGLALALVLGCGDDDSATSAALDASTPRDAASRDARVSRDADEIIDICWSCEPTPDVGAEATPPDPADAAPPPPLTPMPTDELTRVGVSRFDLTPEGWEPWRDLAGEACPKNREGFYDGRLTQEGPDAPCLDAFEDVDGDGRFDALYLGGRNTDRPARAVAQENPPEGRVLLLQRRDVVWLLITLDVYALSAARFEALTARLAGELGLEPRQIAVHATGISNGPDALGLSGPSLRLTDPAMVGLFEGGLGLLEGLAMASGVDEAWWDAVAARAANAARRAASRLRPFKARVGAAELPLEPLALPLDLDGDGVDYDPDDLAAHRAHRPPFAVSERLPDPPDDTLRILALEADDEGAAPIAFLMSWGARVHLEAEPILSGDAPGAARQRIEALYPEAVGVWLTGAGAGWADARAWIPEVDDEGHPVDATGARVAAIEEAAEASEPVEALARYLVAAGLEALVDAPAEPVALSLQQRFVWLPFNNPRHSLAVGLGASPALARWLEGREITDAWASPLNTPACVGLGCLRYRLDLVDLGAVAWATTPGALDDGLVRGREARCLEWGHQRAWSDLDTDGILDAEDERIEREGYIGDLQRLTSHPAPASPQCFEARPSLVEARRWLLGGVNGGVGWMGGWAQHINVFEGQLEPLVALARRYPELELCPGDACLGLEGLVEGALTYHAPCLTDLPGGHSLRIAYAVEGEQAVGAWWIEDPEGARRVEGEALYLGPGDLAFAPDVDFIRAGVAPGDALYLAEGRAFNILEIPRLALEAHPNAGEIWTSAHPNGGDLIYNGLCDLIGACEPRPWQGDDPNALLPRAP